MKTSGLRPFWKAFFRTNRGLRHWAFVGVNDEEDAIDHAENSLDFTAEVGVARSVDQWLILVPRY